MRFLLTAIILIIIGFVIKFDLQQGTVPLTSFYHDDKSCVKESTYSSVTVRVAEGDTIYSLFAATPSPIPMPFPERLAKFYELNPHLQLQSLVAGEQISLPMYIKPLKNCSN